MVAGDLNKLNEIVDEIFTESKTMPDTNRCKNVIILYNINIIEYRIESKLMLVGWMVSSGCCGNCGRGWLWWPCCRCRFTDDAADADDDDEDSQP